MAAKSESNVTSARPLTRPALAEVLEPGLWRLLAVHPPQRAVRVRNGGALWVRAGNRQVARYGDRADEHPGPRALADGLTHHAGPVCIGGHTPDADIRRTGHTRQRRVTFRIPQTTKRSSSR